MHAGSTRRELTNRAGSALWGFMSSHSKLRLRRRSGSAGGGDEPGPIKYFVGLAGGIILAVAGGLLAFSSPSPPNPAEEYPSVPVSVVLQAAKAGEVSAVEISPAVGSAAATVTASGSDGLLSESLGRALSEGESVSFYAPSSVQELLVGDLIDAGVEVSYLASRTATAPARGTMGQPVETATIVPAETKPMWVTALGILFLIAGLFLALWSASRLAGGGQARPRPVDDSQVTTRFDDVAGADEAVAQMRELVDFLANPGKYRAMGAEIPKGALLVGPPGTGKTLLARALAGEAGVPIHSANGAQFVEMYVGVGARRIRDLFKQARKAPAAIIFIDEVDAVARKRSDNSHANGQVESENTLIALLTEMDGFHPDSSVVVIAATNRPDVLDPALTRPGRLDRRIEVPLPDRRGREQILRVHAQKVKVDSSVDVELVAKRTPGFSGAQLAAVVNEAALEAVRRDLAEVTSSCFDAAIAGVAMGRARESALVTEHDRRVTAWHEAGHTAAALLLADADPPVAVSIVPRGPAGGVTWMSGSDDLFLTRAKAHARLVVALAGRAAERMLLGGEYTQGAAGDLQSATETALLMATRYGMTRLGLASRDQHLGGTTTKEVAEVVEELLAEAHAEAEVLLERHRDLVVSIAEALLEHEDLDAADLALLASAAGVAPASTPTPVPVAPNHGSRLSGEGPVPVKEASLRPRRSIAVGTSSVWAVWPWRRRARI